MIEPDPPRATRVLSRWPLKDGATTWLTIRDDEGVEQFRKPYDSPARARTAMARYWGHEGWVECNLWQDGNRHETQTVEGST